MAFSACNLEAVAHALRAKFPGLPLILCADDDVATAGNPGLTRAREAARAAGGLVAIPDFGPDRPDGVSDFNDMATLRSLDATREVVTKAVTSLDTVMDTKTPARWPARQAEENPTAFLALLGKLIPREVRAQAVAAHVVERLPREQVRAILRAALGEEDAKVQSCTLPPSVTVERVGEATGRP